MIFENPKSPEAFPFRRNTLFLMLMAASSAAFSQPEETAQETASDDEIQEILVEGQALREGVTELAIDVARFGTQVQLISADEIATGGFTNFGELSAGLIRGANIGYSPDEGEFTIRIDGGTDRDTLLLLDGVPTYDRGTPLESLWGATAIDPRMIENVEIFRGGQSLYFGGNGGLGVVNVLYKRPEAGDVLHGEFGTYFGDFKTREMYGNVTFPLAQGSNHYLMFFGRSYETDAHEIFDTEAYTDNVLALGGKHAFPYSYNLLGAKYLWAINDVTEFRLGYQFSTIDFRDSFPPFTIFQPNFTEFPMWDVKFRTEFSDRLSLESEAYFTNPRLWNHELDARICGIPRIQDLPADVRALATAQGISSFTTAAQFEAFAATVPGLPAGCVTSPYGSNTTAAITARTGIYVDAQGRPYGTLANPFPIGAPMGYAIQTVASNGNGAPVKGFGDPDQAKAGYNDWGYNNRLKFRFNDNIETVVGLQNITYKDASDPVYGMKQDEVSSTGVYGELRLNSTAFIETNLSISARKDFNDNFADEDIWKYGFRQELPGGFYLRSNGGTSYSQPTLTEAGMVNNRVLNPSLETQQVETYSLGFGINGGLFDGTYNVELGYFDTVIDNQFGAARIENVCANYPGVLPGDINPNIKTPVEFCNYALANGLARTDTATFNVLREQDIKGFTMDVAFDFQQWQADFTFTDMESLEPNPIYNLRALREGTGATQSFVVPGDAGTSPTRQSGERAEWSASLLLTYTPSERWVFALNSKWQGPEWAYGDGRSSRLVDAAGNRTNPDLNFGDYVVFNGSIQYYLGRDLEHRFLLRAVNLLDEDYYERGGLGNQIVSRAAVRREIGLNDSEYYYFYGWNGKPRSFWLQYEYRF
ncbi:MAG: hypothetical protein RLZZ385_1967 [Pseudomonadota bacterium]